jgi:hypothetical protein
LRMKWTRQRCQVAFKTFAMAAFSPSWASETTSLCLSRIETKPTFLRAGREPARHVAAQWSRPSLEYGVASADLKLSIPWARSRFLERKKTEMNWSKNASFADRLSAAAEAKKAQLERAAQARSAAESPEAVERRRAREEVKVARDARIAERKAAKLASEACEAAAQAAAQAAEAAAREVALKADQEARDAEFAERTAREGADEAERQAARDARYADRKARKRKGK